MKSINGVYSKNWQFAEETFYYKKEEIAYEILIAVNQRSNNRNAVGMRDEIEGRIVKDIILSTIDECEYETYEYCIMACEYKIFN